MKRMTPSRRRFLQALGLGSLAGIPWNLSSALGGGLTPPRRIVFFVQPHGHVRTNWKMDIPGSNPALFSERPLADLSSSEFSEVLRPLHPFREHILPIEGLAQTSVLADLSNIRAMHLPDDNDHSVAVAGVLTGVSSLQRVGAIASGGALSIDQEIARRTTEPGRFASRVYGFDYTPNASVTPFSFVGPGQAAPIVHDPATAFADLMGLAPPPPMGTMTREETIRSLRPSVLDTAGREFEWLAPKLEREGRQRLEQHRALVRELELSLEQARTRTCSLTMDATGGSVTQFIKLIRMAFACDLTRVVTFVAPVPNPPEFGYPASTHVHADYAHPSIRGETSCGTVFSETAERAMTDLGIWYAQHVAMLMSELSSVSEGSGTLLDHTVIVWITELATGTHRHNDLCTVLAGGSGFFRLGRYVRFPQNERNPLASDPHTLLGPALNRLFVSLMQSQGLADTQFGATRLQGADGSTLRLDGPLSELHRIV